jgi:cation transport ATPase
MLTRILLVVFLLFSTLITFVTIPDRWMNAGDLVLTIALFASYAWESRRGAFGYRPSLLVLVFSGIVAALIIVEFDRIEQHGSWLFLATVGLLALIQLADYLRARSRGELRGRADLK